MNRTLVALTLFLGLTAQPADAAPVTPAGTWYIGQTFSPEFYDPQASAYRNAGGTEPGERLVLNADGTYLYAKVAPTVYPGSTSGGSMVACRAVTFVFERGTYRVKGSRVSFHPGGNTSTKRFYAPQTTGCPGSSYEKTEVSDNGEFDWQVRGNRFRLTLPEYGDRYVQEWRR